MKRILALLISLLLLVSSATVALAAPTVAYDGSTVILSGTVDGAPAGAPVTVLIVKPDAQGNEADVSTVLGATTTAEFISLLEYAGVVTLDEEANLPQGYAVHLNDSLASGVCGIYVNYLGQNSLEKIGSFKHVNALQLAELVARFNVADADYAAILTAENIDLLKSVGIDDASYDALVGKDAFYAKLKAFAPFEEGKPNADISAPLNLSESFNHALALSYLEESEDTYGTLEAYNGIFWDIKIGEEDDFTGLDQADKDAIVGAIGDKTYAHGDEVSKDFEFLTCVKYLETKVCNKNDATVFFEKYWSLFDVDMSIYNKASAYEKAKICTYFLENKEGADTYEEIKALYYDAVDIIKEEEKEVSSSKPNRKPGGSFGGGGVTVTTPPVVEISPELENSVKPLPFKDVANHWAYDYVSRLYRNNIVSGKSEETFSPDDAITREEFVKIVVEAFDIPVVGNATFADVKDGAWYKPYVAAAVSAGIIKGAGDGTFGIGKKITRQDAAVIISRAAGMTANNTLTFADTTDVAEYASSAIAAMVNEGIITGYEDKTFKPQNEISRAEGCTVICRLLDKKGGLK